MNKTKPGSYLYESLTSEIISSAIEVHSTLGPGLLEGVYEKALCHEFDLRSIKYERQKEIKLIYKNCTVGIHRLDIIVEDKIILELKAVNEVLPIFQAQVLSYLKASELKLGLLINFNVTRLKDGIKRIIL